MLALDSVQRSEAHGPEVDLTLSPDHPETVRNSQALAENPDANPIRICSTSGIEKRETNVQRNSKLQQKRLRSCTFTWAT